MCVESGGIAASNTRLRRPGKRFPLPGAVT